MSKLVAELQLAIMCKRYLELKWYQFFKRKKAWREIECFAQLHNIEIPS